jgi:glutamyl-tRNA reductase
MSFIAVGINHNTAPLEVRERLNFAPEQLPEALKGLAGLPGVQEAAVLSTCNRTEVYCAVSEGDGTVIAEWLSRQRLADPDALATALYCHREEAAIDHVMRVACGLDSMVLGEPQILGQLKRAYQAALEAGTAQRVLHQLFQTCFAVAKQVRTDTGIGEHPVSVAYAAVDLARQIFADFEDHTALLIGAGETIELAARHLAERGIGRVIVANRSVNRAQELAGRHKGFAIGLNDIGAHLAEADIVISSTGSRGPIVSREMAEQAFRRRRHRPVLMVDIAVPRDIDPAIGELRDAYLYSIDDLRATIRENLASRQRAAEQAAEIIASRARQLTGELRSSDAVPLIQALREDAVRERDRSLRTARRMLGSGRDPQMVLDYLANTLTNRILHRPTVGLRKASELGDDELVRAARRLFEQAEDKDTSGS